MKHFLSYNEFPVMSILKSSVAKLEGFEFDCVDKIWDGLGSVRGFQTSKFSWLIG